MVLDIALELVLLPGVYAVCRLEPGARPPRVGPGEGELFSVTVTPEEVSVVCLASRAQAEGAVEGGWRCLRVGGRLDFGLTGILASMVGPLAEAGISVFALSTYDTDYLLVKEDVLAEAVEVLVWAGHQVTRWQ